MQNGKDHDGELFQTCKFNEIASAHQTAQIVELLKEIHKTLDRKFLPLVQIAASGNGLLIKSLTAITGALFVVLILLVSFITHQQVSASGAGFKFNTQGSSE